MNNFIEEIKTPTKNLNKKNKDKRLSPSKNKTKLFFQSTLAILNKRKFLSLSIGASAIIIGLITTIILVTKKDEDLILSSQNNEVLENMDINQIESIIERVNENLEGLANQTVVFDKSQLLFRQQLVDKLAFLNKISSIKRYGKLTVPNEKFHAKLIDNEIHFQLKSLNNNENLWLKLDELNFELKKQNPEKSVFIPDLNVENYFKIKSLFFYGDLNVSNDMFEAKLSSDTSDTDRIFYRLKTKKDHAISWMTESNLNHQLRVNQNNKNAFFVPNEKITNYNYAFSVLNYGDLNKPNSDFEAIFFDYDKSTKFRLKTKSEWLSLTKLNQELYNQKSDAFVPDWKIQGYIKAKTSEIYGYWNINSSWNKSKVIEYLDFLQIHHYEESEEHVGFLTTTNKIIFSLDMLNYLLRINNYQGEKLLFDDVKSLAKYDRWTSVEEYGNLFNLYNQKPIQVTFNNAKKQYEFQIASKKLMDWTVFNQQLNIQGDKNSKNYSTLQESLDANFILANEMLTTDSFIKAYKEQKIALEDSIATYGDWTDVTNWSDFKLKLNSMSADPFLSIIFMEGKVSKTPINNIDEFNQNLLLQKGSSTSKWSQLTIDNIESMEKISASIWSGFPTNKQKFAILKYFYNQNKNSSPLVKVKSQNITIFSEYLQRDIEIPTIAFQIDESDLMLGFYEFYHFIDLINSVNNRNNAIDKSDFQTFLNSISASTISGFSDTSGVVAAHQASRDSSVTTHGDLTDLSALTSRINNEQVEYRLKASTANEDENWMDYETLLKEYLKQMPYIRFNNIFESVVPFQPTSSSTSWSAKFHPTLKNDFKSIDDFNPDVIEHHLKNLSLLKFGDVSATNAEAPIVVGINWINQVPHYNFQIGNKTKVNNLVSWQKVLSDQLGNNVVDSATTLFENTGNKGHYLLSEKTQSWHNSLESHGNWRDFSIIKTTYTPADEEYSFSNDNNATKIVGIIALKNILTSQGTHQTTDSDLENIPSYVKAKSIVKYGDLSVANSSITSNLEENVLTYRLTSRSDESPWLNEEQWNSELLIQGVATAFTPSSAIENYNENLKVQSQNLYGDLATVSLDIKYDFVAQEKPNENKYDVNYTFQASNKAVINSLQELKKQRIIQELNVPSGDLSLANLNTPGAFGTYKNIADIMEQKLSFDLHGYWIKPSNYYWETYDVEKENYVFNIFDSAPKASVASIIGFAALNARLIEQGNEASTEESLKSIPKYLQAKAIFENGNYGTLANNNELISRFDLGNTNKIQYKLVDPNKEIWFTEAGLIDQLLVQENKSFKFIPDQNISNYVESVKAKSIFEYGDLAHDKVIVNYQIINLNEQHSTYKYHFQVNNEGFKKPILGIQHLFKVLIDQEIKTKELWWTQTDFKNFLNSQDNYWGAQISIKKQDSITQYGNWISINNFEVSEYHPDVKFLKFKFKQGDHLEIKGLNLLNVIRTEQGAKPLDVNELSQVDRYEYLKNIFEFGNFKTSDTLNGIYDANQQQWIFDIDKTSVVEKLNLDDLQNLAFKQNIFDWTDIKDRINVHGDSNPLPDSWNHQVILQNSSNYLTSETSLILDFSLITSGILFGLFFIVFLKLLWKKIK